MFSIAILMCCHNRIDKTTLCLENIFNQKIFKVDLLVDIFLVDDGSIDGTRNAVKDFYPQVIIINGDGQLYWNRGMHLAWKTAMSVKNFDYYLWLNDDTFLFNNALEILFTEINMDAIVCGSTKSQISQKITYGGFSSINNNLILPNGKYQLSDYCNGNCVLVPKNVFQKLGNLDPFFHHALGDFDYSLRARKKGIEIKVAPDFIGFCESHHNIPKWRSNSYNFISRLKNLYTPLSGCYPPEFFVFDKRHHGIFAACLHFFTIHIRSICPKLWSKS